MINDETVLNLFFGQRQIKYQIVKKFLNTPEYNYVINKYKDSESFAESLYRIKYNIYERPVCEECGKRLKFYACNRKSSEEQKYPCFPRFCCQKCSNSNKNVREKQQKTCIKLYGDKCNFTKYKETLKNKYGVENTFARQDIIRKLKETWLQKYGVDNYAKLPEHREKLSSKECVEKRNETKRKNGTFNTSKPEDESYNLLKEKYPDVIRQYKDKERYPYYCDFYIQDLDLFIECNYHWTHGDHPYNKNNINDIELANRWKNSDSKYMNIAYNTWTIRDVKKRQIVKENNLNWIEFFNINEFKNWLNKL